MSRKRVRKRVPKTHAARSDELTLCGRQLAVEVEEHEVTCGVCREVVRIRGSQIERGEKIRSELVLIEEEVAKRRKSLGEKLARLTYGQVRQREKTIESCIRQRDDLESELLEIKRRTG
jgi:hypothetical protein